jgi:hypothetical protein
VTSQICSFFQNENVRGEEEEEEEDEEEAPALEEEVDDDPLSFGPHDDAWVQTLLKLDLDNVVNVWAKLHNRKHVSESIIQHRW